MEATATRPSLTDNLYGVPPDCPTAALIREIEEEAAALGLILSRWQTNSRGARLFATQITYAIHGGPRADQGARQERVIRGGKIFLSCAEGKTEASDAYRQLSELLKALHAHKWRAT